MKKLLNAILFVLAINLLALLGGVGYLVQTGKLDKEKALAIKELIFQQPEPEAATTQPVEQPTSRPTAKLDELLAKRTGMTTGEQVDYLQQTFDAQTTQLERRRRELDDLQRQVELAKTQVGRDRAAVDADRAALTTERAEAQRLESDQGFQDSLAMYQSMSGKQVKSIFMTLEDDVVIRYLQAMGPAGAKKILKEFKSPEEVGRVQSIMEKMRLAEASVKE